MHSGHGYYSYMLTCLLMCNQFLDNFMFHISAVSCGDPDTLPYATRHGTTFYYQDEVSYTCVDGFRPSDYSIAGSSTHKTFVITCDKNSDWSERPYCVGMFPPTRLLKYNNTILLYQVMAKVYIF